MLASDKAGVLVLEWPGVSCVAPGGRGLGEGVFLGGVFWKGVTLLMDESSIGDGAAESTKTDD